MSDNLVMLLALVAFMLFGALMAIFAPRESKPEKIVPEKTESVTVNFYFSGDLGELLSDVKIKHTFTTDDNVITLTLFGDLEDVMEVYNYLNRHHRVSYLSVADSEGKVYAQ
jgi:hypothetical protein